MHSFYYNDIDRILKEKRMCLIEERKHLQNETENFKHSKSWKENSNNINENEYENSNINENSYDDDLNFDEENCVGGSGGGGGSAGGRRSTTTRRGSNRNSKLNPFTMFDNNNYDNNNNYNNKDEDLIGNYTRNASAINNYSLLDNGICNENLQMRGNHLLDNNNNNSRNYFDDNLLERFTTFKNIGANEQGITTTNNDNKQQPIIRGKKYASTENKHSKLEKDDMDQWVTDAFFSYFPSINDQIKQKRSENLRMDPNNRIQHKELQPQQRPLFDHHRTRKQDIKKQTKLEYQRDLIKQIEEKKREIEMLRVKEREDDEMLTKKLEDQLKTMHLEDDLEIQKNKTEKLRLTNEQNHLQRMNLLSKLENDHKIYNPYNADRKSQSENGKENLVQKKKDDTEIYKYFSNSARRYADRLKCSIDLYPNVEDQVEHHHQEQQQHPQNQQQHPQNHLEHPHPTHLEPHDRRNSKQMVTNSMIDEQHQQQQNYCPACQHFYYNQLFCINCKSKCLNCNSETLHNNNNSNNNVRLPIPINSSSSYGQHQDHLNHSNYHPHQHQNNHYFNQHPQGFKDYCQHCQHQEQQHQHQRRQNYEHNLICKNCNIKFLKRTNQILSTDVEADKGGYRNFETNRKFKELNDVEQQTEQTADQLLLLKSSISSTTSSSPSSMFYGSVLKPSLNDHNKKPIMTQPTIGMTETIKSINGGAGDVQKINQNISSRSSSESDHDVIIVKNSKQPSIKSKPYSINIEKQSIFHPVNNRNVKSLKHSDDELFYHKTGIEAAAAAAAASTFSSSSSLQSSFSKNNNSNVIKNRIINDGGDELELDKKTQDQINKYVKNYGDLKNNKKNVHNNNNKTIEKSDDSFPLPLLREASNVKNMAIIKDKIPDERSTALKMLERKWEVPAVQKNSMGPSSQQQQQQKSTPRVLTQLGAIRKQLQLEQLKIDDDDDDDALNYGISDDSDDRDVKVYRNNIL